MSDLKSEPSPRPVLADRRHLWAFGLGSLAVTIGVLLHLPMFLMGRNNGYRLVGMAMDPWMIFGMFLIVGGCAVAGFGLLPRKDADASQVRVSVSAPEDAPLTPAHWGLMAVLVVALVIDIMKPASLGFVVPGMIEEYGVSRAMVAWLPFAALAGTVTGSFLWGILADIFGRRATILLSAVMFVGTSICGAMPSFWWNVAMCFMMGISAGGLLPVVYALLAEIMPSRHRGWSLVLVGGLGAVGGYLASSGLSEWLQPYFGWRILWLLNLPTGLILIALNGFIPESAKFLLSLGHVRQAHAVLRRFGSVVTETPAGSPEPIEPGHAEIAAPPIERRYLGKTLALTVAALSWSLINFGIFLWLPKDLTAKGYSVAVASGLLKTSALWALPTVFLCAFLYSRWSTKWSLAAVIGVTALGLAGILQLETARAATSGPLAVVGPVALLIIGSNGLLAILLPYTAETFPMRVRGRATGWVAGCSKFGGLIAQMLSILALVPPLGVAALMIMVPTLASLGLVAVFGSETRGRDLRELDREAG